MSGGWGFFSTVLLPGKTIQVVCESQVEAVKSEEVESALQTVDLSEEGDRTPEPTEETLKRAERKTPRPSLMALLRQMVSPCFQFRETEIHTSASETKEPRSGGET